MYLRSFDFNNPNHGYEISNVFVANVDSVVDLGILKPSEKCLRGTALRIIKHAFRFLNASLPALYKPLCYLFLSIVVWCGAPIMSKTLKYQRRFSVSLSAFRQSSVTRVLIDVDLTHFLNLNTNPRTCSYRLKIKISRSKLDISGHYSSSWVAPIWNRQPIHCVNSSNVDCFKHEISNYFKVAGII